MHKFVVLITFLFCGVLISLSFQLKQKTNHINLSYSIKYKEDTWQKNKTGFLWCLSMLGAELPKGSFEKSIAWKNKNTFELNLKTLGFNNKALAALSLICDSLKQTDIYLKTNSIDIGYFVTITLGSSWHYYQITGAPTTYDEFLKLHQYQNTEVFPVTHSTVSKKQRFIKSNFKGTILETAFIAEEGIGKISDSSFSAKEFNVMDVMPNGQLRFMIYDSLGRLNAGADEYYGISGKPAKCLWCHEINVQTVFEPTDSLPGYVGPYTFDLSVKQKNALLKAYRKTLQSDINYDELQAHTQTELLYIQYMEPSLTKLSQEWKIPEAELKVILKSFPTHLYPEFPFLGDLYHRHQIATKSIYKTGPLPDYIRESGLKEPNYFIKHAK